jgi:Fe-S oxidoreductase
MLENVIDTIENCRYCLMCRHVAPVGIVTFNETLTPHGVALVSASQKRGMIEWDDESIGVIFSEVDGGNSRMHCVNDQPFEESIAAVRAELVASNLAPAVVYEIQQKLHTWGNPYQEIRDVATDGQGDVALFISDETLALNEADMSAATKLLDAIGIQPVMLGGYSNGFMAATLGLMDMAASQAKRVLDQVAAAGARQVVVLSPGDYYTLTQLYTDRLGIALPDNVEVVELTTLLAKHLADGTVNFALASEADSYAYVDPTHAVRVPTRHEAPRQLLNAVATGELHELFWRKDRAHPVGNTAVQFTQPDLAEKLTRARLADAQTSGAAVIVTDDAGTLYQLARFSAEYDLQTMSLFTLLANQLLV